MKQKNIPIAISTGSTTTSYGIKTQNYKNIFSQVDFQIDNFRPITVFSLINQYESPHKFEFVVCCSSDPEVKNGKPHPDAFDIARKRFDPVPEPKKCLAFEDSINGVKSAISQGSRIFRFDNLRSSGQFNPSMSEKNRTLLSAGMQCVMVPDPRLTPDQCKEATIILKSLEDFKPELFGLPKYD